MCTIRPRDPEPIAPLVASLPVLSSEDSSKSDSTGNITQDVAPTPELASLGVAQHYDVGKPQVTAEVVELCESQPAVMLVYEAKAAWWYSMTAEEQINHIILMAAEATTGVEWVSKLYA